MSVTLLVDLHFELDRPGQPAVQGHVSGRDRRLVVEVSDPAAFAGSGDATSVRAIAEALAAQHLVVVVTHGGRPVVSLGAVIAPWWQRRMTGSKRIRVASLRGAWTSALARARRTPSVLPEAGLLPPVTLFPLAPTLGRRRQVTTTHDPRRGGDPRLVLIDPEAGPRRATVHWLHRDEVTVGSDPACDIVLPGLEPVHARLRHDTEDEWVIDADSGITRVHGGPVASQRLRTGSMIELGRHRLAFYREEYADHGRPFGGRVGGELGRNIPQPDRPARGSGEESGQ